MSYFNGVPPLADEPDYDLMEEDINAAIAQEELAAGQAEPPHLSEQQIDAMLAILNGAAPDATNAQVGGAGAGLALANGLNPDAAMSAADIRDAAEELYQPEYYEFGAEEAAGAAAAESPAERAARRAARAERREARAQRRRAREEEPEEERERARPRTLEQLPELDADEVEQLVNDWQQFHDEDPMPPASPVPPPAEAAGVARRILGSMPRGPAGALRYRPAPLAAAAYVIQKTAAGLLTWESIVYLGVLGRSAAVVGGALAHQRVVPVRGAARDIAQRNRALANLAQHGITGGRHHGMGPSMTSRAQLKRQKRMLRSMQEEIAFVERMQVIASDVLAFRIRLCDTAQFFRSPCVAAGYNNAGVYQVHEVPRQ